MTEKFRDEGRPRFGLMRGRQFLMKDLYTFDTDLERAQETYEAVNAIYGKLLDTLELKWIKARGSTGTIGGLMSHEFHLPCEVGEDDIVHCASCNQSFNKDLLENQAERIKVSNVSGVEAVLNAHEPKCFNCGSSSTLSSSTSIEVGHCFLLGTKYTKPLRTFYISENNEKMAMQMGCYGLGVSRLLAAAIEVNCSQEEIRWPSQIAPYLVAIIPPKQGSKEEGIGSPLAIKTYEVLSKIFPGDVIYDDRHNQTIGRRLQDIKKLGIPYIIVCGKAVNDPAGPLLELHDLKGYSINLDNSDNIVQQLNDLNSRIKLGSSL